VERGPFLLLSISQLVMASTLSSSSTLPERKIPPWATLSSGAASGLASCLLLQPMDLLKTRMQQQVIPSEIIPPQDVPIPSDQKKRRGGPSKRTQRLVNTTKTVLREDGVRGLWRGTVPTVARNVPGVAMYFYSVSETRALISRAEIPYLAIPASNPLILTSSSSTSSTLARLTITGNLLSGAIARVAVGFILSPITIVKARFESSHFSKQAYPSLFKALSQLYQKEGVRGLFRGFSATALRDAPYAGIYLACYEKTKHELGKWESAGKQRGSGNSLVVSLSGKSLHLSS
jgi:solute carrier family 25 protein 38